MGIFSTTAPQYYAKGLSVIPLRVHDKVPTVKHWQSFHEAPVPEALQKEWLRNYSSGNIGLVLGAQSNIVMIDVDSEDPDVIAQIETVIPPSPWKRVGKKGYAAAYRYNGLGGFRIKDSDGVMLVEHLSTRMQVVLPPSIHPTTGQPYVANCELLEVYDKLPKLPDNIEVLLRDALEVKGHKLAAETRLSTVSHVAAGSRDVQMVRMAGLCARGVLRGEYSFQKALDDMQAWYDARVEKVVGDDIDITKGLRKIAEFIRNDVNERDVNLPVGWDEDCSRERLKEYGLDFSEEQKQWDYNKLNTFLNEQFTAHSKKSPERMAAVEKVLKKMATSLHVSITPVEENLLLDKIRSTFGTAMSLSAMRRQMYQYAAGPIEGKDHTEIAKAMVGDLERETEFRYHNEDFWTFEGSHWEVMSNQQIRLRIAENYGSLDAARKASDHKGIEDIMKHITSQGLQEIEVQGVNFANGVFTESGALVPHKHEYGFTYTLPYRYIPDISHKAPMFHKFLETSWGRDPDYEQKVDALQEAICATMFGWATRYQRVFCLKGVPRSGKSQLLEIIEGLVPTGSVASISFDKWVDGPSLVTLDHKLVNIVGELSVSRKIRSDVFNKVVVGEAISMRQMYKSTYLTRLKAAHWVGSNHLPKSDDPSAGFNRRWLYLEFNFQVQPEDVIPHLGRKIIIHEREAILSWAMEARNRLVENSEYTLPDSHKELAETTAGQNDSVRHFVVSGGEVETAEDLDKVSPISDLQLHGYYMNFCVMQGITRPVELRVFQLRLRELGQILGWRREQGQSTVTKQRVSLYYGPVIVKEKEKKV